MNMDYFGYLGGLEMTNRLFEREFGGPPRKPESPITRREMDLACSIQKVVEMALLRLARHAREITGCRALCLAGGVALNCVANGKIMREGIFEDLWIQPAAGDAGGALGAALAIWHNHLGHPRQADGHADRMKGALLGPEFPDELIESFLRSNGYPYRKLEEEEWAGELAKLISDQKVLGLLTGRMEFGPRALGDRSILGDARSADMQSTMNQKIKFRESFRPFAPACLEERAEEYFDLDRPSPYMLLVAPVKTERRLKPPETDAHLDCDALVAQCRSDIPAVTHVDYSARVQTVSPGTNPRFYRLLKAFEGLTGCGVLVNTSFNVRGEPIVCTPGDAYRCFMRTDMDFLAMGSFLLDKSKQPPID
jgi:carbamoyltransferase